MPPPMADQDHNRTSRVSREVQTMPRTPPSNSRREGTETEPDTSSLPETPRKRLRHQQAPRVIHINTDEYEAHLNDVVTEPWVTPRICAYLYKFINYYNEKGPRFPIHRVPSPLRWSVVDENPRYMHVTHENRPVLMWVVATVVDASLVVTATSPRPVFASCWTSSAERDRKEAIALYNKAASVNLSRMETLIVTAPTNDNEGPPTYEEIYDATERFQQKGKMNHVTQAKLFAGDLVLAECTLVLAEVDRPGAKSVSWVMNAVFWLAEKPKPPKSPVLYEEPPFPEVFTL
ncbi:hypothetical protein C8T65DRAFT_703721 [Cerioporus squamosus]|nr:hypothetical protein C8T65DRAFT_703721 [Cerioporus squamosus]